MLVVTAFQFHELYFNGKVSYWLNQVDKRIDNCDQRMTVEYVAGGRGQDSGWSWGRHCFCVPRNPRSVPLCAVVHNVTGVAPHDHQPQIANGLQPTRLYARDSVRTVSCAILAILWSHRWQTVRVGCRQVLFGTYSSEYCLWFQLAALTTSVAFIGSVRDGCNAEP